MHVNVGGELVICCQASRADAVKWTNVSQSRTESQRDGVINDRQRADDIFNSTEYYDIQWMDINGISYSVLRLQNVRKSNLGLYTCSATNNDTKNTIEYNVLGK